MRPSHYSKLNIGFSNTGMANPIRWVPRVGRYLYATGLLARDQDNPAAERGPLSTGQEFS